MNSNTVLRAAVFILVGGGLLGCGQQTETLAGDLFYQIETGGVLAGYAVVDTSLVMEDGRDLILLEQFIYYETTLLGFDMDSEMWMTFVLDPTTKEVLRHQGESSTSPNTVRWSMEKRDGGYHFSSSLKQDSMMIDLPSDVIVENPLFFGHVVADFAGTALMEKTYRLLDLADFVIRDTRYGKHAEEALELDGSSYEVVVVDKSVAATGSLVRMWIDTDSKMVMKVLEQDGNVITLADPTVTNRVERADLDKYFLDKTDVAIADVAGITYMKVRARIRPIGLQATAERLNVPGQRFTGTVEDNLIEGVFEIAHIPYDGANAPAFPSAGADPEVAEFLAADSIFETDDAVLAAKARDITAGAADAWEAATRLAAWVSAEINYAIPGGGTARNTYNLRAGECGAHSILLATFCRTVGIPARMVWGCMYTPNLGGSFGQHGWTEVHMGDAGWIPVDATVGETDFVDSGHIRVGHFGSLISRLNGQEFEILDYRVAGAGAEDGRAMEERMAFFLGPYRQGESSQEVAVRVMDGSLVVDLKDKVMLALEEPDSQGRWLCKMAKHVFVSFGPQNQNGDGVEASFTLHEVYTLPRQFMPDVRTEGVPADLEPCLGAYHLAALGDDFTVSWENGRLGLHHPHLDQTFQLKRVAETGRWRTENGPYTITFIKGTAGAVESLELDAASEFRRN